MSSDFRPVKRPGALSRKARAAGESLSEYARSHGGPGSGRTGREIAFYKAQKKWHRGGRKSKRSRSR